MRRLRLAIDKEWIRAGWGGSLTFRHRLIALLPTAVATLLAMAAETFSRSLGEGILLLGLMASLVLLSYIVARRFMAMSTRRSERLARRGWRGNNSSPPKRDGT
jgi:hypothetical protein